MIIHIVIQAWVHTLSSVDETSWSLYMYNGLYVEYEYASLNNDIMMIICIVTNDDLNQYILDPNLS